MTWFGRLVEWLFSFLPTPMPIGRTSFDSWAESVLRIAGVPDNRSTRAALAAETMHISAKDAARGKRFFARKMRKIAANEVAHAIFSEAHEEKKKQAHEEAKTEVQALIDSHPEWVELYRSEKKKDAQTLFINEFYKNTQLPQRQEINKLLEQVLNDKLSNPSSEVSPDAAGVEPQKA